MKALRRAMREWIRDTEPRAGAEERLRARLAAPRHILTEVAAEPRPGALDRLRAGARHRRSPRRIPWLLPGASLVLAAAAALFVVGRERDLNQELLAEEWRDLSLTADVTTQLLGSGSVRGTESAPRLRWDVGTVRLDVVPGQGVDLIVETVEGTVQVLGTSFEVRRDALGTTTTVSRGHVRVTCHAGGSADLGAGESTTCLPTRAGGWLARALLRRGSAPDEAVLADVDRGLATSAPADPTHGELLAMRASLLAALGRDDEARAAARAYLATGAEARREEFEAFLGQGHQDPASVKKE